MKRFKNLIALAVLGVLAVGGGVGVSAGAKNNEEPTQQVKAAIGDIVCGGEMLSKPDKSKGWGDTSDNDVYGGNGLKFNKSNQHLKTPSFGSKAFKSVKLDVISGYNGSSGSYFTIDACNAKNVVLDSWKLTPDQPYKSQTKTYSYTFTATETIDYLKATFTKASSNCAIKYFAVVEVETAEATGVKITNSKPLEITSGTLNEPLETSLKVSIDYDNGTTKTDPTLVVWTSLNLDVATIDENGVMTFKKNGTATFKASIGNFFDSIVVTASNLKVKLKEITISNADFAAYNNSKKYKNFDVNGDSVNDITIEYLQVMNQSNKIQIKKSVGYIKGLVNPNYSLRKITLSNSNVDTITVNPLTLDKGNNVKLANNTLTFDVNDGYQSFTIIGNKTITISSIVLEYEEISLENKMNAWSKHAMHIGDTNFDNTDDSGKCSDPKDNLYWNAKKALFAIGNDAILDLQTRAEDDATVMRYLAWARANNDAKPFEEVYNSSNINILDDNNMMLITIISVSALAVSSIAIFAFTKKRKHA